MLSEHAKNVKREFSPKRRLKGKKEEVDVKDRNPCIDKISIFAWVVPSGDIRGLLGIIQKKCLLFASFQDHELSFGFCGNVSV